MQKYVVAFVFNTDFTSVLLMHKNRPAWQDGLVNGLGGKVNDGEDTFATVSREVEEESGLQIPKDSWVKVGKVHCKWRRDRLCRRCTWIYSRLKACPELCGGYKRISEQTNPGSGFRY